VARGRPSPGRFLCGSAKTGLMHGDGWPQHCRLLAPSPAPRLGRDCTEGLILAKQPAQLRIMLGSMVDRLFTLGVILFGVVLPAAFIVFVLFR